MEKTVFYTTHCPMCSALERELKKKEILYEECDDIDHMRDIGLSHAPALEIDGKLMNFKEALAYLKEK